MHELSPKTKAIPQAARSLPDRVAAHDYYRRHAALTNPCIKKDVFGSHLQVTGFDGRAMRRDAPSEINGLVIEYPGSV